MATRRCRDEKSLAISRNAGAGLDRPRCQRTSVYGKSEDRVLGERHAFQVRSGVHFLGELDEFLRGECAVVIRVERNFQFLAEQLRLYDVAFRADFELILEHVRQEFPGDVLVFQSAPPTGKLVGRIGRPTISTSNRRGRRREHGQSMRSVFDRPRRGFWPCPGKVAVDENGWRLKNFSIAKRLRTRDTWFSPTQIENILRKKPLSLTQGLIEK